MATARTLTRVGVRVASGLAGVAAVVLVVGAAFVLPLSGAEAKPIGQTVVPVPADAQLACPGGLMTAASDASATALASIGDAKVVAAAVGVKPTQQLLQAPDDTRSDAAAPLAFSVPAAGGAKSAPLLAAAQSQTASTPDVAGLATAACTEPSSDSWLVAGSTALGESSLVLLSNPGDVAATVDLAVFTEQGAVDAPGARGIVVQPHSEHVLSLAGIAPNANASVVHVTARGTGIAAYLEQSAVSGVTPQGVALAAPVAAPARHLVIPGVTVDTTAQSAAAGSDAGDAGAPVLRVLPTGDKDAQLNITAAPESGTKGGGSRTVTVTHGVVSEIPLDWLGTGTFTVTVTSPAPVAAAIGTSTVANGNTDLAWYGATNALQGAIPFAASYAPSGWLHLFNPGAKKVTLKIGLVGHPSTSVDVPANASVGFKLTDAGAYVIADAQGVYASVTNAAPGQISGYPVYPLSAAASPLTVYGR